MALFHLSVTQTKRSAGQSAIASAAYRSGEKLYSEYYGEYSDYTRKGGVICSDILLPSHVPPEYADRQTLWNAVEKAERGKNAQLAYSFDIALQNEFSLEENIALARQFLLEQFVSRGMVVDFAVHQPDREDGGIPNPHFHVLCPIRPIEQNGKWGCKQHRVYELDEDGNRIRDADGKFVFNAVPTTDWGSPETLEYWRQTWAELCNAKFAEKGIDVRIDHRSYERQGVELLPTVHEGATVRAMEKKGIRTEKGEFNRWIKATNAVIRDIKKKIALLFDWIAEAKAELAKPQAPDLVSLLNAYYTQRRAGAYSQKGKVSNLKEMNETFNYLRANGIYSLEDLESRVSEHSAATESLKKTLDEQTARMKAIKQLYDSSAAFQSLKPVYDGLQKIKFEKPRAKYKAEHEAELKQFYAARRKLTGEFPDGKVDMKKLTEEYDELEQAHNTTYGEFKTVRDDLHRLWKVKSCVDILPSDLSTYGGAAKNLLQDLQSRNERMFNMTFLMLHLAPTKQKLEIAVSQSASVAQTHNCILTRLDFQQEDGLMSSLPLGLNRIRIERSLTTSALAVFVPFVTQELFMGGDAMYYGLNALSGNMILLDRKQSRCPNGLVFGTPGSGKSMSCKREITYVMLTTKDNVIICDPEDEYSPLVNRLGGQVIRLSPSSRDYVNPLDINLNYSEEENPLALKSDFVLSFCELIMGSKTGLEAIEKTVIDRAVQKIYQPYFADPRPENMPVLGDLLNALMAQGIPEADRVAQALDLYVNGSLNFFNHRTTVDIRNRLVCFDIKGLGKNLKKPGMLIVQDAVWNTVTVNRSIGRATWYFVDEFHLLLKEEQTAAYSAEIWKRFRKWGGVPTGATQNPKDLLSSPEIENILENSDFIYLLNLSAGDRKLMTERLNISAEQLAYVTNADPGSGLLFFQNVILPFKDEFPKTTELYRLLTTKPSEVSHDGQSG